VRLVLKLTSDTRPSGHGSGKRWSPPLPSGGGVGDSLLSLSLFFFLFENYTISPLFFNQKFLVL